MSAALDKIERQRTDQKLASDFWKSLWAAQWRQLGSNWRYIRGPLTFFIRGQFGLSNEEQLPEEVFKTLNRVEHIIRSRPARRRGRRIRRHNLQRRQGEMFQGAG